MFSFTDATKEKAKARIALVGPAGSGKTFTALTLATAFGGPIGLVDTERGSASKYSGRGGFKFKTLQLSRFDPVKFPDVMTAAAEVCASGTLIIDSFTSWWNGVGGMIEYVDKLASASRSGNSFQAWGKARPVEKALIDALLAFPGHVIVTMRSKTEYVIEEDERGKKVPKKVGTAPEQRSGVEYEFDIVGDMNVENTFVVSKSRCTPVREAQAFRRPGGDLAKMVLDWLNDGEEPAQKPIVAANDTGGPGLSKTQTAPADPVESRLQAELEAADTPQTLETAAVKVQKAKQDKTLTVEARQRLIRIYSAKKNAIISAAGGARR